MMSKADDLRTSDEKWLKVISAEEGEGNVGSPLGISAAVIESSSLPFFVYLKIDNNENIQIQRSTVCKQGLYVDKTRKKFQQFKKSMGEFFF